MNQHTGEQATSVDQARYQQLLERLTHVYGHQVPFHNLIGFTFEEVSAESCRLSFKHKPELVGNFVHKMLHGGVIATALDTIGGTMAAAGVLSRNLNASEAEIGKKMSKISTIDLRVDYVRPAKGESFYAIARLLRSGNKVAVVRMELHSEDDTLVALGTGTFMTG